MGNAVGCGRAGLRGVSARIKRIVTVRGGMPKRINLLINLSRVIPVGVAGDKTVAGVEPVADRGLVAANAVGWRDVLCGDGRSGCVR